MRFAVAVIAAALAAVRLTACASGASSPKSTAPPPAAAGPQADSRAAELLLELGYLHRAVEMAKQLGPPGAGLYHRGRAALWLEGPERQRWADRRPGNPERARKYQARAREALARRAHTQAIRALEQSFEALPEPQTLVQIALLFQLEGNPVEARRFFDRAMAIAEAIEAEPAQARLPPGHRGGVSDSVVSWDGAHAATLGNDNTVRVWDLALGVDVAQHAPTRELGFAGEQVLVGDCSELRLWDWRSDQTRPIARPTSCIRATAPSALGLFLLLESGELALIDRQGAWRSLGTVDKNATSVVASADGSRVALASHDESLWVYDTDPLRERGHWPDKGSRFALSDNGMWLARAKPQLERLDVASLRWETVRDVGTFSAVAFRGEQLLALDVSGQLHRLSRGDEVRLFESELGDFSTTDDHFQSTAAGPVWVANRKIIRHVDKQPLEVKFGSRGAAVGALAFNPAGDSFALGLEDNTLLVSPIGDVRNLMGRATLVKNRVREIAWTASDLVVTRPAEISAWSPLLGQRLWQAQAARYAPGAGGVLLKIDKHELTLTPVGKPEPIQRLPAPPARAQDLVLSPAGERVAAIGETGLMVWSGSAWTAPIAEHIASAEFSSDGRYLFAFAANCRATVVILGPSPSPECDLLRFDAQTLEPQEPLRHDSRISELATSRERLAVGTVSGKVSLWNIDGASELVVTPREASITALALHPKRPVVALGYADGPVVLFDFERRQVLVTIATDVGDRNRLEPPGFMQPVAKDRERTGSEWVALFPDGELDGSLGGASLMYWQVGHQFFPGEAGWTRAHRPGRLRNLLRELAGGE